MAGYQLREAILMMNNDGILSIQIGNYSIPFNQLKGHLSCFRPPYFQSTFEESVWLIFKRFNAESRGGKKLVIQCADGNILPLLLGAWASGWVVCFLRSDAIPEHVASLNTYFDEFLRITHSNEEGLVVHIGSNRFLFDDWLTEKSIVKDVYCWQEEEWALTLFTSGSTGRPKGVCHSLSNVIRAAYTYVEHFDIKSNDRYCCLAPLHTTASLRSLFIPLLCNAHIIMTTKEANETFLMFIQRIMQLKPTLVLGGPVFMKLLANYGERFSGFFSGVHTFLSGGAELCENDRAVVEKIHQVPVINTYGSTEALGTVLYESGQRDLSNTSLSPIQGITPLLKPVGSNNEINEIFQLGYQSPNLFLGYLGENLAKKEVFYSDDLVIKNPAGNLQLVGRLAKAFKGKKEEWVFPDLLEQWLKTQTNIKDAVVTAEKIDNNTMLDVLIDCTISDFDGWYFNLNSEIAEQLGEEYAVIRNWKKVTITRTLFGKLESIKEQEIKV